MVDIARQPVIAPRLPWRGISLAIALLALLAAAAVLVGSQQRLPPPFGIAGNGLIAYASDGDIYAAEPVSGRATAIVSGPETDLAPYFSRDGTHIVFERKVSGDVGPGLLFVARSDGSAITLVTPEPVLLTQSLLGEPWPAYAFSPDGGSVLIATATKGVKTVSIAQTDGSGVRELTVEMSVYEPSFRPPNGAEILFVGADRQGVLGSGLYAVDPKSGAVRTIIEPSGTYDLAGATWSPDGSQIAYWRWGGPGEGLTARTRVISADGTGDRELPAPQGAVWNAGSAWSNDGSRLMIRRGYTPYLEDVRAVVIPASGDSVGVEMRVPSLVNGACCAAWEWAPDDSTILGTLIDADGRPVQQVLLDPVKGEVHPTPWTSTSDPTWQRIAH
jgi:hypothetical protein